MPRLFLLFVLCVVPSFAVCNPGSTSGCSAVVCGGATSSAAAVTGTSYTGPVYTIAGITQICGQTFQTSPRTGKFDCAWPTTGATGKIVDYRPSGGWKPPNWWSSFYTQTYGLIVLSQLTNSTVCTHDSVSTSVAAWPAQAQEDEQFLFWLVADAGTKVPGNRQMIVETGDSSSAHLALIQLLTYKQTKPWTELGNNTTTSAYKIIGAVGLYVPNCIATGCSYPSTQFSSDIIDTVVVHSGGGGTNYAIGDTITPTLSGCSGTQLKVATVTGSAVATVSIVNYGTGCPPSASVHSAVATTTSGSGSGLTLDMTIGETYDGNAFAGLLGTALWDVAAEATFDTANKVSPILWMTSSNPNIHVPMLFVSGLNDQVVPNNQLAPLVPPWGTPMNSQAAQSVLGALGVQVANFVYPGDHENAMQPGGSTGNCSAAFFCGPQYDAVNFINNVSVPSQYVP